VPPVPPLPLAGPGLPPAPVVTATFVPDGNGITSIAAPPAPPPPPDTAVLEGSTPPPPPPPPTTVTLTLVLYLG
jgi:hypothetical protein